MGYVNLPLESNKVDFPISNCLFQKPGRCSKYRIKMYGDIGPLDALPYSVSLLVVVLHSTEYNISLMLSCS